jgi:hypothetical protein
MIIVVVSCCVTYATAPLGEGSSCNQDESVMNKILQLEKKVSMIQADWKREVLTMQNQHKEEYNSIVYHFRSLQEIQEKLDERLKYEISEI